MAYVYGNPPTKKSLKEMLARGEYPEIFNPGLGQPTRNGEELVEGPHFPDPHNWYARVRVADGKVVKIIS